VVLEKDLGGEVKNMELDYGIAAIVQAILSHPSAAMVMVAFVIMLIRYRHSC